jgi:phosphohistidine swiveling domain-containing protein
MKFEKNYTRDTTIIIQQIWAQELSFGLAEKKNIKNPYLPVIIHYILDGSIEIWDNAQATLWLTSTLLELNNKNDTQLKADIQRYLEVLAEIKTYWARGSVNTLEEFNTYLKLLREGMFLFNAWYYTAVNEKTPQHLLDITLDLRKEDAFFANNDIFIRATLKSLYPNLVGVETALLLEEVNNPPERAILETRIKGAALIDGKDLFLGSHEAFEKAHPDFQLAGEKAEQGATSVKGQIAFKGKCQGVAHILRRRDQVGEIKEGDILISPMTTPDFLPAMQKAIAFVTDEGGITCHAAIVAREMKKPCVIGTKVATQVFKDGDLIEVDAETGVVRIIK